MKIISIMLCCIIIILASIGAIVVMVAICATIDKLIKQYEHKKAKRKVLHAISFYCDTHNVPIWAEENATRLIQNDYPFRKVMTMLYDRTISTDTVNKLMGKNE